MPAERAWALATSFTGINAEFRPLLRMTVPPGARGLNLDEVPVGPPIGRSWILLFGLFPVDYDDLCLVEVEVPRRFLERSRTLAFGLWQHERVVEAAPAGADAPGCSVTDRLVFRLKSPLDRLPGAGSLAQLIVGALFSYRHRRLRRRDNRDTSAQ